ncbi:MAG: choline-sulfatase [Anaerolineae bacterium]|nr:choline-sulfatase [Anaerolineae bacterium]
MSSPSYDRPNILLIMADQMTPFLTGAYGHPVVMTPNLDRLVEEGVRFDAAYSSCPLCAPARASLMTAQYIAHCKVWDNAAPLASDQPTVAHYLTLAGYDTVASGKLHYIGPDQLHGFRTRLTTDSYPASMAWLPTPKRKPGERVLDRRQHARSYALPNAGVRTWSTYLAYDEETEFRAIEYLRQRGMARERGEETAPFFLTVSFHCPHDPHHVTQELWDLYEGAEIEIPHYPANMEETYSAMDRWLNAYHGTDRIDIKSPESLRALRRAYYGLVTSVDQRVGHVLKALEDARLAENTIILFTADHGDMLAEKNMVQKRSFYEFSCRVPLIFRFPDGWQAGVTCRQPASLVDIVPTMLDLAGVEEHRPIDGHSLLPCMGGEERDRVVYSESHTNGVYAVCIMARQHEFKYIYIHGEKDQLFDVEADPGEWHNLVDDPAYAQVAQGMRDQILSRFDPDAIEAELQESLLARPIVHQATVANDTHWDHFPYFDATKQYAR